MTINSSKNSKIDIYYSIPDIVNMLGIKYRMVQWLIKSKQLKAYKVRKDKSIKGYVYRISKTDLQDYLNTWTPTK